MNSLSLYILLNEWSGIMTSAYAAWYSVDSLCLLLCPIFGLVGAIRIYNKWHLNSHRHFELDAATASWLGGSIFWVLAHVFLKTVIAI
jgi:hypothetical protein